MRRPSLALSLAWALAACSVYDSSLLTDGPHEGAGGVGGVSGNGGTGQGAGQAGGPVAGQSGSAGGGAAGGAGTSAGQGGNAGASGKSGASGASGKSGAGGGADCSHPKLVVNEVSTSWQDNFSDEFVEIFNTTSCTVMLDGWQLRYSSDLATVKSTPYWSGTAKDAIDAGGYFVVGGSKFSGTPQGALSAGLSEDGGGVGLYDVSGKRVDGVAWADAKSTNPQCEGSPSGASFGNGSAGRLPDGADSDDNENDFQECASRTPGAPNVGKTTR